jgi:hypothetical protein
MSGPGEMGLQTRSLRTSQRKCAARRTLVLVCAEPIDGALRGHAPTGCLPAVASCPSRSTETAGHLRAHVADAAPAADAI